MTFWPTLVFGQAASRAGVITTLEGRATAARVVLPNPVPLHFKDDVFLNDEITTAEKSLARILLGGKAVVTVRERSSLTITEVPGLSTIDIASGKIAMAVARERMRPGEQIQIRTPNAITGIRGTSLIVEVIRSIADTKQPDPNAITRLGVFNGNVDVQHINPITKAPLAPPVNVAINTKFSASGTQPASVAAFAPGDAASFQQGVTPSGPQHVQAANETALAAQATETANALLTALGAGAVVAPPLVPTPLSTVDTRPELNDDNSTELSCAEQPSQPSCQSQPVVQVPTPTPPPPTPRGQLPTGVPSNIAIDPALEPFIGTATTSVVQIPSGSAAISTPGSAIEVGASTPTPAELAIPLLTVTNGSLSVGGNLLNVLGTLTSTTTLPLIGLDPTTLSIGGDLIRVAPGGVMSVAGGLVSDSGGTLNVDGSLISVEAGGTLRHTGAGAAVSLVGTNATIGGDVLRVQRGPAGGVGSFPRPITAISTEGAPLGIAITPNGSTVYVANGGGGEFGDAARTISVINAQTNTLVGSINLGEAGGNPVGVAVSPDGGLLYVTRLGSSAILLVSTATNSVTGSIDVGSSPRAVAFSPDGSRAWVANQGSGTVSVIDTVNGQVVATIPVGGRPFGIAVTATNAYVTNQDTLSIINTSTNAVSTIAVGEIPFGTAASPNGSRVYVANRDSNTVSVVDTATNTVIATVDVGNSPRGIGVSPDGSRIYVTNQGDSTVSVIDGSTNTVVATVPVESSPFGVAVSGNGTVYVSNEFSSSVSVLRSTITSLVGLSREPFLSFENSVVSADRLVSIGDGGSAYIVGPLIDATDSTITANTLLELGVDAQLTTGDDSDAVLRFINSNVTVGRGIVLNSGAIMSVDRDLVRLSEAQLRVAGSVLDMTGASLFTNRAIARVEDGSLLEAAGPFARLAGGSSLTADALIDTDGSSNRLRLGGLLDLSNSTAVLDELCDCSSNDLVTWTLLPNQPIIRLTSGDLVVTDASSLIRRAGTDEGPTIEPGVTLIASQAPGSARRSFIAAEDGTLFDFGAIHLTDPNAQLQLSGTDVFARDALIQVFADARTGGPLLDAINSAILTQTGELLGVYAPLLIDGTGQAVLRFRDSSVITGTEIVLIAGGGRLELTRGLVDAVNTPFFTQSFDTYLTIAGGGSLTAATPSPLISLTNSPVTMQPGEDFIHVGSPIFGNEGRASLSLTGGGSLVRLQDMNLDLLFNGALLRVTGADVSLGGPIFEAVNANLTFDGPVVYVSNGGRLTTSAGPAFKVTGGSLTADSLIGTDGEGNVVTFTGTVADFTNATVTLNRAERALEPIVVVPSGPNVPLLRMSSSTLTLNEAQPLFDFGVDEGTPITLSGVALIATGTATAPSQLNVPSLLDLGGVTFTDPNPQVQLTRTVINQRLPASFITISGQPVTTAGPLLSASFSTFDLGGSLLDIGSGTLAAAGAGVGAFLQFFGSTASSPSDLVRIGAASVSLDRGFIDAIDSTFATAGGALVGVDAASVSVAGNLLRFAGTSASGRLLAARNTSLDAGSSLLHLDAGTLTINGPAPGAALQLLNSSIETGTHLVSLVSNSRLDFERGLLDAVDSSVATRDGSILAAFGDARITAASIAPLLHFSGSSVTADDNFIALAAATAGGPAPIVSLGGPLLTASLSDLANGDATINARGFVSVADGARLSSTTTEPLVSLDRGSLTTTGSAFNVRRSGPVASTLALAGPLLAAQDSAITAFSTALRDTANAERLCCNLLAVGQGGQLTSTTGSPLIDLLRTSLALGDRFAVVFDTTSILDEPVITAPGVVSLAGPLARVVGAPASPATIIGLEDFLGIFRSSLTATTTAPLISLDRAAVVLGGTSPFDQAITVSGRFLQLAGSVTTPSSLTLAGPLLNANDSVIATNDDLFAVFGGARLTNTSTEPLISLTGGSVSAGAIGNFFTMAAAAGVPPPVVTLAGPLLRARGLTLSNGDPATNTQAFMFVGDGATLTNTSPQALLDFERTAVVTGTLFTVRRPGPTLSTVDLDGPLLLATDSSISTAASALRNRNNQSVLCCGVLSVGEGATFNSDSPSPLIDLARTSVITGDRLVTVFDATSVLNEPELVARRSFLTLDGPLLRAVGGGGGISTRTDLLGIFGSTVTSTTPDALISVHGIPLTLGGTSQLDGTQTFGRVLQMNGPAARPAILQLNGALFKSVDVDITTTADVFSFFNGAQASSTAPTPFIDITGGSVTAGANGTFLGLASNTGQPASMMSLAGSLLLAADTTFMNGSAATGTSFLFLGDGATLTTGGTNAALLDFRNSSVVTAGNLVELRRSPTMTTPTKMTLSGPLLAATNSHFNTPIFSGFFVAEGAELRSATQLPLIELTSSTFNAAAGNQVGFDFFTLTDTDGFSGSPADARPALLAVNGPFLKASQSGINARPDVLSVTRSTFSSTSTESLIELDGSTVNATGSLVRVNDGKLLAATVAALANAINNSSVTTGSDAASLTGANGVVELKDLVRLSNSSMTINTGSLANVTAGRLTVSGNLVSLTGNSILNVLNGVLLNVMNGGVVNIGGSLVSFTGSSNMINVMNNLAPTTFIGGIPIHVAGTAAASLSINGTPLSGLNTTTNVIRINNTVLQPGATGGVTGSLIAIQGTGGTVRIAP